MKKIDLSDKRILISRTDSIGDVLLTLPICAWIKSEYPSATILFLGKGYTLPIIRSYKDIDECYDWQQYENVPIVQKLSLFRELRADVIIHVFPNRDIASLAKKINIPVRVGTSHRSFHLLTCNHRVNFTRKRSDLHEAQLNFELLRPFGLNQLPELTPLNQMTERFFPKTTPLPEALQAFINDNPGFVVLHPKSKGSAQEWPIENYMALARQLVAKNTAVIFTGTDAEGKAFREDIPTFKGVYDSTGQLTLEQLVTLIGESKGIVACSTGPLHIGGFLGIRTVGLYSPKRPIHPGRWRPLGKNALALVNDSECANCKAKKSCSCIEQISVERVLEALYQ